MRKSLIITAVAFVAAAAWSITGYGQTPRTVWDGVYSAAQAEHGEKVFADQCSSCHGPEMRGGPGAPALVGPDFEFSWDKMPVGGLYDYVRMFMPPGQAANISDAEVVDVVAALLKGNGFPASEAATLPATKDELDTITVLFTKP
jgi:mono/diheme cytochrome c family protein